LTKEEALKLALEALTYIHAETSTEEDALIDEAITAIEEALAQPALEPMQGTPFGGMNRDDWKDVVSAISKVRDSRGIYLACRPADVFQDWFLLFGTGKLKEKNFD